MEPCESKRPASTASSTPARGTTAVAIAATVRSERARCRSMPHRFGSRCGNLGWGGSAVGKPRRLLLEMCKGVNDSFTPMTPSHCSNCVLTRMPRDKDYSACGAINCPLAQQAMRATSNGTSNTNLVSLHFRFVGQLLPNKTDSQRLVTSRVSTNLASFSHDTFALFDEAPVWRIRRMDQPATANRRSFMMGTFMPVHFTSSSSEIRLPVFHVVNSTVG